MSDIFMDAIDEAFDEDVSYEARSSMPMTQHDLGELSAVTSRRKRRREDTFQPGLQWDPTDGQFHCNIQDCGETFMTLGGVRAHIKFHDVRGDLADSEDKRPRVDFSLEESPQSIERTTFSSSDHSWIEMLEMDQDPLSEESPQEGTESTTSTLSEHSAVTFRRKRRREDTSQSGLQMDPTDGQFHCNIQDCGETFMTLGGVRAHIKFHDVRGDLADSKNKRSRIDDSVLGEPPQHSSREPPKHLSEEPPLSAESAAPSFACTHPGCGRSFSSARGLAVHARSHRAKKI